MKNKKLRAFYEAQNARLNDWLEVDAIVMEMADDVLDSMNPDADNDGVRERRGGLQEFEGNIASLLPEDEQQRRQKAERNARWAININVLANIVLLVAKVRLPPEVTRLALLFTHPLIHSPTHSLTHPV